MLLYLMYNYKLTTFSLPKLIKGNYIIHDYDDYGAKRNLFNIEEISNEWHICSNYDNKVIVGGRVQDKVKLQVYSFYQLKIYTGESIIIYICQAYDNTFIQKRLKNQTSITIGKSSECDVIYNNNLLNDKQISLNYQDGRFIYQNLNLNTVVYINGIAKNEGILQGSVSIFCMGLRIQICGPYLFINSPNNYVRLNSKNFDELRLSLANKNYLPQSDIYKDYYEERDYFSKSPVFKKRIIPLDLTITPPPHKETADNDSILMEIIPSVLMMLSSIVMGYYAISNLKSGSDSTSKDSAVLEITMCVSLLLASVVWPFFERSYQKKKYNQKEKKRIISYNKYLGQKEQILKKENENQKIILKDNYITLEDCYEAIVKKNFNLFYKNRERDDFLTIRLGVGSGKLSYNLSYQKEDFLEEEDELVEKIDKILQENEIIDNVPVGISLYENNVIAFISDTVDDKKYLNALILQLIATHSYTELKIVVLTNKVGEKKLSFLKKINHLFNNDKTVRFFASNIEEAQQLSAYLEKELNNRKANAKSNDDNWMIPYYLIISDSIINYRNLEIIKQIMEEKQNQGFGLLMFEKKISSIPNDCNYFVNYNEQNGTLFNNITGNENFINFKPEFLPDSISLDKCCSHLANIPVRLDEQTNLSIPVNVGFLEMYQVGKIEQLNILNRWQNSNLNTSLAVPLGIDQYGNTLNIDLHEKKHGPHGLIAGMTGSGKSELIISLILSLAVNYRPDEVQFVLIDYKGGGLAGAFENRKTGLKLPHLVGTITNLDKSSMKRSLISIQSELQRRQKLFNEAKEKLNTGTIDIYKYQKLHREGKLSIPMSHLFIICDEFAELKDQQPDFMESLVSTARIGRSLGIHLILATQKPSGVVDEQIWSNSRFKICCKVQTEEDSKEMIRREDAAYIKEVGRFFLQVGYDEFFAEAQSAYTGGIYIPTDKIKSKIDNRIVYINDIGESLKIVEIGEEERKQQENLGEELVNIINYINQLALEQGYQYQQLWLNNISNKIYIEDVKSKYMNQIKNEKSILNPVIGEYDNPKEQTQGLLSLPLSEKGNVCVIGVAGSGKTTLLATIIYSLIMTHRTEEVNIYIIDLGLENLKRFEHAPQVSEILTITDEKKIVTLFNILKEESQRRKKLFVESGMEFREYSQKHNLPNIVVMINGFDVFKETFEDLYDEEFVPFTRDCHKNGIIFIITVTSTNSLEYRIQNNFPQLIAMHLLDSSDYYEIFEERELAIQNNPGRGLIKLDEVYEFQTALLFEENQEDYNLNYIFNKLSQSLPKVPNVPVMPNTIKVEQLKPWITNDKIPIGLSIKTIAPVFINLSFPIQLILSKKADIINNFLESLLKMFNYCNNTKLIFLNANNSDEEDLKFNLSNVKYYNQNFKSLMDYLNTNIISIENSEQALKYVIIIKGYNKIERHLRKLKQENEEESIKTLDDIIMLANQTKKFKILLIDVDENVNMLRRAIWYNEINKSTGFWLGEGIEDQEIIKCKVPSSITYDESNDLGYRINDGEIEVFEYVEGD